jgi:hypothetical protein
MSERKFHGWAGLGCTHQERPLRVELFDSVHTLHGRDELGDGQTFRHFRFSVEANEEELILSTWLQSQYFILEIPHGSPRDFAD